MPATARVAAIDFIAAIKWLEIEGGREREELVMSVNGGATV